MMKLMQVVILVLLWCRWGMYRVGGGDGMVFESDDTVVCRW